MCLPSGTDHFGYSCACPDGYILATDGINCTGKPINPIFPISNTS
jgi:hypothetical protein